MPFNEFSITKPAADGDDFNVTTDKAVVAVDPIAHNLRDMSYQIDNGKQVPIDISNPVDGTIEFSIDPTYCPKIGQEYTLTVYGEDLQGNSVKDARKFIRSG